MADPTTTRPQRSVTARVEAIHVGGPDGGPSEVVDRVLVDAGKGIRGERNYGRPEPGSNLTLIGAEGIEAMVAETQIPLEPVETRRNILTRGLDLDTLVGRRFRVGEVLALGIGPCNPCSHLESVTRPGVLRGLVGRGGLRADVLAGGAIRAGDPIEVLDQAAGAD